MSPAWSILIALTPVFLRPIWEECWPHVRNKTVIPFIKRCNNAIWAFASDPSRIASLQALDDSKRVAEPVSIIGPQEKVSSACIDTAPRWQPSIVPKKFGMPVFDVQDPFEIDENPIYLHTLIFREYLEGCA